MFFAFLVFCNFVLIGDNAPVVLSDSTELPDCLQIWLVKAWEHIVAVVDLKLSVQVLQAVN